MMNTMSGQSEHSNDRSEFENPVTLADIARVTGFSQMTVSNALRDKPKVSAKNRARIKQVADTATSCWYASRPAWNARRSER